MSVRAERERLRGIVADSHSVVARIFSFHPNEPTYGRLPTSYGAPPTPIAPVPKEPRRIPYRTIFLIDESYNAEVSTLP